MASDRRLHLAPSSEPPSVPRGAGALSPLPATRATSVVASGDGRDLVVARGAATPGTSRGHCLNGEMRTRVELLMRCV